MVRALSEVAARCPRLIALSDQGLVSVTNFATTMMIGRVCGKAELGVYTLAWTLMSLVTGISSTVIATPYTVFSPRLAHSRRRRFRGSILMHQLLLSTMFALTIAAAAFLASRAGWVSENISTVVTTAAAVLLCIGVREFVRGVSFAELRTSWALSVDVIACCGQAAGLLLLLYCQALTASRALVVLGMSSGLAAAVWFALHGKAFRFNTKLLAQDWRRNWDFAKWVFGSAIAWQAATYLYPWMLTIFHGTSATGAWAACSAIVATANPVLLGLNNYVSPKIANVYASGGILEMKRYVHRSSLTFAALLSPLVLVLVTFGDRILVAVYGGEYSGAIALLFPLSANILINSLSGPYAQGLFNLKRAKADMFVNVVSIVLLFTIGIFAVKFYGTLGAATALLASTLVATGIRMAIFTREPSNRASAVPHCDPCFVPTQELDRESTSVGTP
jgi:O-antigen/teichoic acid export membrane protein